MSYVIRYAPCTPFGPLYLRQSQMHHLYLRQSQMHPLHFRQTQMCTQPLGMIRLCPLHLRYAPCTSGRLRCTPCISDISRCSPFPLRLIENTQMRPLHLRQTQMCTQPLRLIKLYPPYLNQTQMHPLLVRCTPCTSGSLRYTSQRYLFTS